MMTPEQCSALNRDGFLIAHNAFSPAETHELLGGLSELPPAHAHRNLLDHPFIQRFSTADSTRALITPILGASAFPVRGILFDKLPDANWKVAWHQDLSIAVKERHEVDGFGPWSVKEGVPHVQPPVAVLENMLTLRLHLDDCFADNGPVRVLPGSHRVGILNADRIQEFRAQNSEVPATTAAGGMLLMRPLLLHASSPATRPSHRRVIHIEYAAAELPAPLRWNAA